MSILLRVAALVLAMTATATAQAPARSDSSRRAAPSPAKSAPRGPALDETALRLQVALDRAGFSPGAIDGHGGGNTARAQQACESRGCALDLTREPLTAYTVSDDDARGPFTPDIPNDLVQQAALDALDYRDVVEALAERFHTTPALLRTLNPSASFAAGDALRVPDVEPFALPARPQAAAANPAAARTVPDARAQADARKEAIARMAARPDVVITVSRAGSAMTVTDGAGAVVFYAPVTTGSEHDPLPIGEWKVNGTRLFPEFHYNPALFWDADASHTKSTLRPGPNNPVGLVWIDISKDHYGLHGTPEPQTVGHRASHGCVRLTNWDAVRLASLVKPGTRVVFTE